MENNEMTEREMLELAANAAGITGYRYSVSFGCMANWNESDGGWFDACCLWNPLEDDGDALRLAAALRIDITNLNDRVSAACDDSFYSVSTPGGSDMAAGIRLAITKVAAAAGNRMA